MTELSDNLYNRQVARHQPKLKLWSSAGLMLSYKCNCACEFCYYNCGPDKGGLMSVDTAIGAWAALRALAGDSARVHLTGGEPFLYWDRLVEILEEANSRGLGGAELVETNGFWARQHRTVIERLETLNALGIRRLKISTDPFHQEHVGIEPVRLLARTAEEVLGAARVQVRWREYLDRPAGIAGVPAEQRWVRLVAAAREHPCRFTGRAAGRLAQTLASERVESLASANCGKAFLGAKGVHIDPFGNVFSGTCSGIIIGNVNERPLDELWSQFEPGRCELIGTLFSRGPAGLLQRAVEAGYAPAPFYADKCHLCTSIRQFFVDNGIAGHVLGPAECYG